jgi:glycosyltransferase involved in cell wall biosynthesis
LNSPIRKVTVAICTWNRCEALRVTLEQFTRLRVPEGLAWELLIVNNCCTDATDQVVKSFESRLPIRLLHETTPGQSHARNLAIREATGSHIAWTDDDVLVDSEWLASLVRAFEQYDATWVFGSSEPEWPSRAPAWYSERFRGYFAALDYGPESFVVTDWNQPFYGLNFAGTREAHIALHGFRTEFGFRGNEGGIGEDVDMFERALRSGMRIVYTPHDRDRHVIPPARVRKRYHRHRQWVANQVYYRYVDEIFPKVRYLFGLPRFFYSEAARDVLGYARSLIRGTQSDRFYHELQILRFVKLSAEAARHGFKRPARTATAVRQTNDAGPVRP